MTNPGRNDPCPCGSGKKLQHCCSAFGTQTPLNRPVQARREPGTNGFRHSADKTTQHHQVKRPKAAQQVRNRGDALATQGRTSEAIAHYERALSLNPDDAPAHNNLGLMLATQGRTSEAIIHYERALSLNPGDASAHYNLGNIFRTQGRLNEAISQYQCALSLNPDAPLVHNNMGLALAAQGRINEAIAQYERALSLNPGSANTHNNMGNMFRAQGRINEAIAQYERALSLNPYDSMAYNNLGNALREQGLIDQAVAHYERALSFNSDNALAHKNLGSVLALQGQLGHATSHYERALSLQPGNVTIHNSLLLMLNYMSDKDPAAIYAAHHNFSSRWETPLSTLIQAHTNDRSLERHLRIGYVSSEFRQHSVAYFLEPVLAHHDHVHFEIFCYSNNPIEDDVTERLKSYADHWQCIAGFSDEQTAQHIRADKIDILIDLNGHSGSSCLLVFARKPAPIQITWLGYPNTTGLSAIDYRITDQFADPLGMTENFHSEVLVRLPECFSCYQPPRDTPEVSGLPAREKGYVTFGSFNNLAKITPEVITTWAQILLAVPDSRLVIKNPALGGNTTHQMTQKAFMKLGITPERLELLGHDPSQKVHLKRYWNIDIGLDTFPYNGTTTTCEALWMGVPVVTLVGKSHAGRVGMSQMSNLGLTELISRTPEDYVTTAARLANSLEHLDTLRKELRSRIAGSALMDGQRFTKNLEQAYRAMWLDWCKDIR
jgi:protein O-GlcNAc transferase